MKTMLKALPMLLMLGLAINVTQAQTVTGKDKPGVTTQTQTQTQEIGKSTDVNKSTVKVTGKRSTPVATTADKKDLSKPTVQTRTEPTASVTKPTAISKSTVSTAPQPTVGKRIDESPVSRDNSVQINKQTRPAPISTQVSKDDGEKKDKLNKQKKHRKHNGKVPRGRALGWHRNHSESGK